MKFVLAIAAIATSTTLLAPTVASAQARQGVSSSIAVGAADLTSADGQKRFKERTARVIRRMCADGGDRSIGTRRDVRQCVEEASVNADEALRIAIADRQTRLAARQ